MAEKTKSLENRPRKRPEASSPARTPTPSVSPSGFGFAGLQGAAGNMALQRAAHEEGDKDGLTGTVSPHFGHDLSRIPLHTPAIAASLIQRKPNISPPGDPYEREAEDVSGEVMRMSESTPVALQGKGPQCENEDKRPIQTKREPSLNTEMTLDAGATTRAAEGGGVPLPKEVRSYFERRFGHDFSQVRVHADGKAADAARAVQARAYTIGRDIVFGSGQYAPATGEGKRLLSHELVHTLQPGGSGQVRRAPDAQASPKSADDALADLIDHNPAWGSWAGGTGSVESYQEMEANLPSNLSEGPFYHSTEFRAWYFEGWRGLKRLKDPTGALQLVAAVLVPDGAARKRFFADIKIGPPGGEVGAATGKLDQARKAGKTDQAVDLIEQINLANDLEHAEATGNYDLVDYDTLAKGRKMISGSGHQMFERWTLNGVEVSMEEVGRIVNKEQVPQVGKDWKWFAIAAAAGEMSVRGPGEQWSKTGKIPNKALGGVYIRYYQLADGQVLTREDWHRVDPTTDDEFGNRLMRTIWAASMMPENLPDDIGYSASEMYGAWTAGRMRPGRWVPATPAKLKSRPSSPTKPGGTASHDEPSAGTPTKPAETTHDEPMAILPNGTKLAPDSYSGGYYGTNLPPDVVMKTGLPKGGDDWRLLEHSESRSDSAFIGTTQSPSDAAHQRGAAYWPGEGGYVYQIQGVPTWDLNKALQGRVETFGGFRGTLMHGEGEYVIPAGVPPEKITRWGVVKADSRQRLYVEWHTEKPK
jgi:hypothetical protein